MKFFDLKLRIVYLLFYLCNYIAGVGSELTTRPVNATRYVGESVEFHCGSNATIYGTSNLVPVNWVFSKEKDCVYCIGTLTYKYIGRYYVNTSVPGQYPLRVVNSTKNDSGVYTCIDDAGFGPDVASAVLIVVDRPNGTNTIQNVKLDLVSIVVPIAIVTFLVVISVIIVIICQTIYTETLCIEQITRGQEGVVIYLKCKMSKASQIFHICGIYKPKWYLDGNLIDPTSDDQSDEMQRLRKKLDISKDGCQLVIRGATTEDSGNYMVIFAGQRSLIELNCEDICIHCTLPLKDNIYQIGTRISLVVVMNKPDVAIGWFKADEMMILSSRITIETEKKAHHLTIDSAVLEDAGNYEVRLIDTGRSISSAKIEVETEEMKRRRMHCEGWIQKSPYIYIYIQRPMPI